MLKDDILRIKLVLNITFYKWKKLLDSESVCCLSAVVNLMSIVGSITSCSLNLCAAG